MPKTFKNKKIHEFSFAAEYRDNNLKFCLLFTEMYNKKLQMKFCLSIMMIEKNLTVALYRFSKPLSFFGHISDYSVLKSAFGSF